MYGYSTTKEAADRIGVSQRQLQRFGVERVGASYVIPDRQLLALKRSRATGRRWAVRTVLASLDLLSGGEAPYMTTSERSRLKRRLREMDLGALCGQILQNRVELRRSSSAAAPPAASILGELGLAGSGGTGVLVAEDAASEARLQRLSKDPNGNVVTVTGQRQHRKLLEAAAFVVYGDSRESRAARAWLDHARNNVL